ARVVWSGELEEDSLIPFVAQLRAQLQKAGQERLEHVIIDGDTTTTGSTNINDIGNASAQTATNLHLLFNGFRKSPLVTTTANSRSGGALTPEDYLETVKLMGGAGVNALGVFDIDSGQVRDVPLPVPTPPVGFHFGSATYLDAAGNLVFPVFDNNGTTARLLKYDGTQISNMSFSLDVLSPALLALKDGRAAWISDVKMPSGNFESRLIVQDFSAGKPAVDVGAASGVSPPYVAGDKVFGLLNNLLYDGVSGDLIEYDVTTGKLRVIEPDTYPLPL
ncbi:MAG: hypothetical protein AAB538_01415, partial [Patescibacteria group bacterium]